MTSLQSRARENIDLLVLFVVFLGFIVISFDYPERTRQFPLIFLVLGFALVIVEITAKALPERYSQRFEVLTEGLASEIEGLSEDERPEGREEQLDDTIDFWKISAAILLFLAATMLIGMLYAIPIFVFVIFALTTRKWLRAALVSAVLMAIAFYLFGQIMNVPIEESMFL